MATDKLNGTEALLESIRDETRSTNNRLDRMDGRLGTLTEAMHAMLDLMTDMNAATIGQNALIAEAIKDTAAQNASMASLMIQAVQAVEGRLSSMETKIDRMTDGKTR